MNISKILKLANVYYSLASKHVSGKFLRVFDFDHVLAVSRGLPWVINNETGEEYRLFKDNPLLPDSFTWKFNDKRNYWVIDQMPPGFQLDWREFNDMIVDGKPIDKYFNIFKGIFENSPNETIILTSRGNPQTIKDFLKENGLDFPIDQIYTIASPNAEDKSWVINSLMEDYGFRNVKFWDDSKDNIQAVNLLQDIWGDKANIETVLVQKK